MRPNPAKHAIVLVGPKGSGKSTIGDALETQLGLRFVRVEPVFLTLGESLGVKHPDFERLGFEAVLARLRRELRDIDVICFESTGASEHFASLLDDLGQSASLLLVQVAADPAQCVDRIGQRDGSIHIPVSDDQVDRINDLAFQVELPWALRIDNRGAFDSDAIVRSVRDLLGSTRPVTRLASNKGIERTPSALD